MLQNKIARRSCRHPCHSSGQEGVSLIEVLIATVIFAIVAVGILPLFLRAMENNISGFDSHQATQHARVDLEGFLTLAVDDPRLDLNDPLPEHTVQSSSVGAGGDEMLLVDRYWDQGARAQVPASSLRTCNLVVGATAKTVDGDTDCIKLGEGDWVAAPAGAKGFVFWQRRSVVRQYTYADISDGVIDQAGTQLVTLGHAQLFDRPLLSGAPRASAHFKEDTVELKSERSGDASIEVAHLGATTMELGPGGHRARLVRTF